jgi:S1-C subfamily serine protease
MMSVVMLLGLCSTPAAAQGKEPSTLEKLEREILAVVERVRPSVVQVTAAFSVEQGKPLETLVLSGVVYSEDGHIVTDASGVEKAGELRVTVLGRTHRARHVASDRRTGVAVLKVEAKGLKPAPLADDGCRAGAAAIVVGNSFGAPGGVSFGNVGGLGRSVIVGGRKYDDMIQMSAPAHPGDCGGYVADSSGRLIGLIHSVHAPDDGRPGAGDLLELFGKSAKDLAPVRGQAVTFATSGDWVRFSADRIIKHGRMVRGWLGLTARPIEEALRAQLGLAEGEGAEVVRVDREGPARRAQIAARDVLVAWDGQAVRGLPSLQWRVARIEEPTRVKITYLRNGERRDAEVQVEIDPQKE